LLGSPFSGATPAQATTKSTAFILWRSFYFSVFNSTWKYPALFVVLESLSGIWRAHDSMTTSKWNYRTRNENPRVHSCHKNQARRDAETPRYLTVGQASDDERRRRQWRPVDAAGVDAFWRYRWLHSKLLGIWRRRSPTSFGSLCLFTSAAPGILDLSWPRFLLDSSNFKSN